jgi:hypothetical protein
LTTYFSWSPPQKALVAGTSPSSSGTGSPLLSTRFFLASPRTPGASTPRPRSGKLPFEPLPHFSKSSRRTNARIRHIFLLNPAAGSRAPRAELLRVKD